MIYTDDDVPGATDGSDRKVVRKPDWSPERLRHGDYVGGLCAVRTSVVRDVGGFRPDSGALKTTT